jgi:25S rRNA (adenine2142-N1)-methyltransferase
MAKVAAAKSQKHSSSSRSKPKKSSLKAGRPPLSKASKSSETGKSSSLSSKHTRTLINDHHLLQKRLATARSQNDVSTIQDLEAQLAAQGGLESYQLASRTGQSVQRGGDSSKVLVEWLRDEISLRRNACSTGSKEQRAYEPARPHLTPLRILEVGALSTRNALNIPGVTEVKRIDLRSSEEGIEEIDFMDFPVPGKRRAGKGDGNDHTNRENETGYDILSLSLVLNYVPDPRARGDMLRRTALFLDVSSSSGLEDDDSSSAEIKSHIPKSSSMLPCLFLVLPAPCLDNSRYLTPAQLESIFGSLGYIHLHTKTTRKLHYSLWRYDGKRAARAWAKDGGQTIFKKNEIRPGGGRNNFCIVLV